MKGMDYQYIIVEDFTDYAKQATWNILHAYIDARSKTIIDEYPVGVVQDMTILQSQCANMNFMTGEGTIYCFRKWCVHKGG